MPSWLWKLGSLAPQGQFCSFSDPKQWTWKSKPKKANKDLINCGFLINGFFFFLFFPPLSRQPLHKNIHSPTVHQLFFLLLAYLVLHSKMPERMFAAVLHAARLAAIRSWQGESVGEEREVVSLAEEAWAMWRLGEGEKASAHVIEFGVKKTQVLVPALPHSCCVLALRLYYSLSPNWLSCGGRK